MDAVDREYTDHPFYGSRRIAVAVSTPERPVNRKAVQRVMRRLGLSAVGPKPRLSAPHPDHEKYPYLLRNVPIVRVNQVWSSDITYIRMRRGFGYLTAVMDWCSRYVISWRLSNTMDAAFCVEALEAALARGQPEVFNTDQGSQFTCKDFLTPLKARGVAISMDGRGRALDNVWIERLWRSVKYENVYLNDYADLRDARHHLEGYFEFYNRVRPHQGLDYRPPADIYAHPASGT
jgi:putative transposase